MKRATGSFLELLENPVLIQKLYSQDHIGQSQRNEQTDSELLQSIRSFGRQKVHKFIDSKAQWYSTDLGAG
jgi:hypothetical protein